MNSQKYTYHRRLHKIIIQNRQTYQNLIICVIEIAKQIHRANSLNKNMNFFAEKSLNENIASMNEKLSAIKNAKNAKNVSNELNEVKQSFAKHRSSKNDFRNKRARFQFKNVKFRKLLTLFNVHAKLHLKQITY